MDLSFEATEKYFWTWVDFWRLGPRRFAQRAEERSESYLTAVQFFMASLLLMAVAWAVAYAALAEVPQNVAAAKHIPTFAGDPKLATMRRGLLVACLAIVGVLPQRLVLLWPLRSPAGIKEMLTAKLYSVGALGVVAASADALLTYPVLWLAQQVSDRNAAIVLVCWALGELGIIIVVSIYYDISTMCAFARLRRRRYVEGVFSQMFVVVVLTLLLETIVFIGLAIVEGEWVWVAIFGSALCVVLALFIWYVKRRLPKLRGLVQTEYIAY